ncbi:putative nucleocapsid protein [Cavally virus]|uniref:Putative nucleocapsid protein n=1 Tax=Alphamesonivirus 1 (isolate Aedes harrisoni/Cote d'Ivoire/C79/2004) TaxID=1552985 RepID=F8RL32_AMV79|nr:putative nucleocapsid protein [Cavally virus]AEH26447.1 putative nucleocapsid protein [Cavally virus]
MPATVSNTNNANAQPGTSKQNRPTKNSKTGNAMAPKPQRQRKQPQQQQSAQQPKQLPPPGTPKQKRNQPNAAAPAQPKAKKAIATGPNYTETNGKLYKIGKEFDARNHMGWRKNEKTGSTIQFLFKPKMASRIDQVYYRNQFEDPDHYIHTFGVGIFVQDSTLERNAIYNHTKLTTEEKDEYVRKLSDAFNAILLRTRQAFDSGALPALTVDAA